MKASNSKLTDQFKAARRASTPLVAIGTPDPAATVEVISKALNGDTPAVQWDIVRGVYPVNETGHKYLTGLGEELSRTKFENSATFAPIALLTLAAQFPEKAVLFVHQAHAWLADPAVRQALWNLRDAFKRDRRMLVLLGPSFTLPPELAGDVVTLDEPLPNENELAQIVRDIYDAAKQPHHEPTFKKAVEALTGLPAFAAEQVTAMSMQPKKGVDLDGLWERKRQQIDNTPGLKVYREKITLDDIGGVSQIKAFISRIMTGQARPNCVVFIDEIEKMLAGARGDTSGVSQDQLGVVLSYMQDQAATGMIFVGPAGSAKSMVAKAAGGIAVVPTVQLDMGGLKGSLVGQSEQQLRAALKVITAVSNQRSLWIATCNSIAELPPELRRRFTLGTFFFDLPDQDERSAIWDIYYQRYKPNLACDLAHMNCKDWTGAEIRQCCDLAWRLGITLNEAAEYIVPIARSAADQIEKLRSQSDGKFLSASRPGVYTRLDTKAEYSRSRRGRALEPVEA